MFTRSILPALKNIPASGVVWVTKNKADARVYGKDIQEVYLEEGSRIIGGGWRRWIFGFEGKIYYKFIRLLESFRA